jgi:hypothetical protein
MIPLPILPVVSVIKRVPREVWYVLAVVIFFAILRWHWIDVGFDRCQEGNKRAEAAALAESVKQEKEAPAVAQAAIEAVKPQVTERVRIIREKIPSTIVCPDYDDGVQQVLREAASAAD